MNKFAERLKESLKSKEMSQSELARILKLSQTTVNKYCSGEREPTLDSLMLICQTLNESADYMLGLID